MGMDIVGADTYPDLYTRVDVFVSAQPNPAAGADLSFTVPIGVLWNVVSITALFTASAGVANRTVNFQVKDQNGKLAYQYAIGTALTAGQTCTYTFSEDVVTPTSSANGGVVLEPLPSTWFPSDWSFGTVTTNIQTGDQWSVVGAWIQAYLPPEGE